MIQRWGNNGLQMVDVLVKARISKEVKQNKELQRISGTIIGNNHKLILFCLIKKLYLMTWICMKGVGKVIEEFTKCLSAWVEVNTRIKMY